MRKPQAFPSHCGKRGKVVRLFHAFHNDGIATKRPSRDIVQNPKGGLTMSQLHKRFTSDQVKEFLERYSKNEVERKYIQEILGIKRRRFFMLLKEYKENPQLFTIQYRKTKGARKGPFLNSGSPCRTKSKHIFRGFIPS